MDQLWHFLCSRGAPAAQTSPCGSLRLGWNRLLITSHSCLEDLLVKLCGVFTFSTMAASWRRGNNLALFQTEQARVPLETKMPKHQAPGRSWVARFPLVGQCCLPSGKAISQGAVGTGLGAFLKLRVPRKESEASSAGGALSVKGSWNKGNGKGTKPHKTPHTAGGRGRCCGEGSWMLTGCRVV